MGFTSLRKSRSYRIIYYDLNFFFKLLTSDMEGSASKHVDERGLSDIGHADDEDVGLGDVSPVVALRRGQQFLGGWEELERVD